MTTRPGANAKKRQSGVGAGLRTALAGISLLGMVVAWDLIGKQEAVNAESQVADSPTPEPTWTPTATPLPSPTPWPTLEPLADLSPVPTLKPLSWLEERENEGERDDDDGHSATVSGAEGTVVLPQVAPMPTLAPLPELPAPPPPPPPPPAPSSSSKSSKSSSSGGGGGGSSKSGGS